MIMSSPYFLKEKLQLNLNAISLKIYLSMFCSGVLIFIIGIIKFFFPSDLWYIPFVIVMGCMCYYVLKTTNDFMIAVKVMSMLDEDED